MASPDAHEWQIAIESELESLRINGTWTLVDLPPGHKAITVRWLFKRKRNPDGTVERYKARLVVQGYKQVEGIDYDEVYAPVSSYSTFRVFLALVAKYGMVCENLDVKTAFLQGEIAETVYIAQPPGYHQGSTKMVCLLHKAIYGLKQAPRAWHLKLKTELLRLGFVASDADASLYFHRSEQILVPLLSYVDDLLGSSVDPSKWQSLKRKLMGTFDMRDLGTTTSFLGMEIVRDLEKRTLRLTQRRLTTELVSRFGLTSAKGRSTPLDKSTKLVPTTPETALDTKQFAYSALVGSLQYLAHGTRPDIAQAVGLLARYSSNPSVQHWDAAKCVLRYLAGTPDMGITYAPEDADVLHGYCDADYAADLSTRKCTTGYVFKVHGGAVSWASRLQKSTALSTAEAEYMAASSAAQESIWLSRLLADFEIETKPVLILTDNQAALHLTDNPITSQWAKHIDVRVHFAREKVELGDVTYKYCPTEHMVADMLTKALDVAPFRAGRIGMGLS